jgi:type II secretory pathway component PulL
VLRCPRQILRFAQDDSLADAGTDVHLVVLSAAKDDGLAGAGTDVDLVVLSAAKDDGLADAGTDVDLVVLSEAKDLADRPMCSGARARSFASLRMTVLRAQGRMFISSS